jgi:RHS repeat-associated protein
MGRPTTLQGYTNPQSTSDFSRCVSPASQPITSATIASYIGFGGATNQVKICYANITLATNFGLAGTTEYSGGSPPLPMVATVILLTDNSTWSFQYDSYGNVTYMGLPLGGSIQYQWGTNFSLVCSSGSASIPSASRVVTQRTLTDNNGNSYVWKYSYGTPRCNTPFTNTMTDPLGNDTVNTFIQLPASSNMDNLNDFPAPYFVSTAQSYQGSQGSGALLKQEDYQYYNNGQPPATFITDGFATQIKTTINGQVSLVTRTPDSSLGPNLPPFGLVTVEKQYDWGNGQPGGALKETDISYAWQGTGTTAQQYLAANLIGLPATVQVKDGNGNICSETDNGYDDPNRLTSYGTVIGNVGAPNPVRGNLTSVSRKLTSSACSVGSSTPAVTSYTNWYDIGQVMQSIDPMGNISSHSYDPFYNGAYPTKTCNAASHCVSATYDFNTGVVTSFTNANATTQASGNTPGDSAHTTRYLYDNQARMTQAISPPDPDSNGAQAVTAFNYPVPISLPFSVSRSKSTTTALADSVTTTYDGLGRPFKTVHNSAGGDTVLTSYDGLDHVVTVTNPFVSASDSTYGVTQTQFDGLGRVIQVAPPDGTALTGSSSCLANNVCTDYSNFPTVTVTDQVGNVRRTRNDVLGRLVEVDEPGPGANSGGTPGSGTITISGSLYSTTTSGNKATGWFTVSGADVCITKCLSGGGCGPRGSGGTKVCDRGTVSVSINGGLPSGTGYGQGSNAAIMANTIASGLSPHPVTWTTNGAGTISVTADVPGPNYSLSAQSKTGDPNDFGDGSSFNVQLSGPSLTGGVYPVTTYDSGTLTVTVNGFQASAPYNQNLNASASNMATALTGALNAAGSPVTASLSGTTITLKAKGVGTATNYTVSGSSTASFTASSTTLTGGSNPSGIDAPYVTLYSYDPLGNLLGVNQKGDGSQAARVRTFTYDSLSRLQTAFNPESGNTLYGYDADGNMLQRTLPAANQAQGSTATQTISYCYDALNRVTGKADSARNCSNGQLPAGTAAVSYTYDAGPNAIGHLVSLTDPAGSASFTYDVLGRMSSEQRTTAGITKTIGYSYDLGNSLYQLTYPSGSVVTYTPDAAGRTLSVIDGGNNINYITGATYGADNSLTGFTSGSNGSFAGITSGLQYNPRLQLCRITALTSGTLPSSCTDATHIGNVLDLGYNFNLGVANNGNASAVTNYKDTTRSQSFTYDQLNRLTSAQNNGSDCSQKLLNGATKFWGNSYNYDAWGNLTQKTVTKCSAENWSASVGSNNQLQSGYVYDAAGNMTHNATANVNYTYDAENRLTGAGGYGYTYDADGNRVEKSTAGASPTGTIYWYSSVGIIAESDLSGIMQHEYVFFDGDRVARKDLATNSVAYYFADHLKTTSIITDASGTITEDEDFSPWGAELPFVNNDSNDYKFTGKKRDVESTLDYFGARYYSNTFGRFLTPDWSPGPATIPYAHLERPQTLNLYSYVDNNPINGMDADGHAAMAIQAPSISCEAALMGCSPFPMLDSNVSGSDSGGLGAGLAVWQLVAQGGKGNAQNQTTVLTVKDVVKIIEQAQKSGSDPVTTAIQIFNSLGNNVSVTGDALRQAIAQTHFNLDDTTKAMLANATSLTKNGNQVTINSQSETEQKIQGFQVRVETIVAFRVNADKTNPSFADINGLGVHIGVWLDVQKVSVGPYKKGKALFIQAGKGWVHKTAAVPIE